ncbi:MAG: hypothetical protein H7Z14_04475 [Anaerolineae bacterium]|nr:hypothetical protein [Phycisphaerae bacterium]
MNVLLPSWLHRYGALNGQVATVPRVRWSVLHFACHAVRDGRFNDARALMTQESDHVPTDAPCLNLMGVLAMAHGHWDEAARLWRQALHADRTYLPSRRNLRRYFELFQFGRSSVPIALGDEPQCFTHAWDEP